MNKLLIYMLSSLLLVSSSGLHARFTQSDTWEGRDHDPITLNKYIYANSDPVNFTDPSGNFSISGVLRAINIQSKLGTLSTTGARSALNRFLVGNTTRTAATGATTSNSSLGLIGNMIMQEMREAVIDILFDFAISGIDPFDPKSTFGTKSHSQLERRIVKLNRDLDIRFNTRRRWGLDINAEAFFDKGSGRATSRRAKGSFGIDVTISQGGKTLRAFDLKTGSGWSKVEARKRAKSLGSALFQIYVVPKK
jgi:hypothetical protein